MNMTVTRTASISQTGRVAEEPDPEVPARAQRRRYSAAYRQKILAEYEALDRAGKGALLRREGLYMLLISAWRERATRARSRRWARPRGAGQLIRGTGSWRGCAGRTSGCLRSWTRPGP